MTKQKAHGMTWAVVAALAVPALAMAQAAGPQAATPAGGVQVQQQDRYVVGRALPPEVPGTQRVEMTLEQAIERALEKNLDIQTAKLNPQMQDYTLQAARANFRPTISSTYGYNNSSRAGSTQFEPDRTTTQSNSLNGTVSQRLPWMGGQASANWQNSRSSDDNPFSTNNPNIRTSLQFSYSQPLLAGRSIDGQRNSLRTGEIQKTIVDIQLQNSIETVKNNVRTRYWSLRQAIEAIEIQRRALALSTQQLADQRIRVEIGTLAEIDLVQQDLQIAQGEQSLLAAEIAWRNAELAFKRLLVDSTTDDLFRATIIPTELPSFAEQTVDIPAAVKRAIDERTDIVIQRQNLRVTEMGLELSKNGTMPTLNLSTSYNVTGAGGNRFDRDGNLTTQLSYADALKDLFERTTPTWSVSLNFSKPLGLSAQKANHLRSELQYQQSLTSLKSTELNIETAVTTAGLDVQSTYKQLLAAQKSRQAAERTLDAELTRFGVGMSTNFQVIQLQNSLTSARNNELTATIRYINAVAEFDRVQRIGG